MDSVTATTTRPGTANNAAPQDRGGNLISSDFQTFLLMLTTQIQNQDPLNPMESTEFAQQLATFSGVEQQVKTNTLLESLSDKLGLSGLAQLAPWVGMEARVDAPVMFDGAPLTLYPVPDASADQAVLVVYDASGGEVMRSPAAVSSAPMDWAGTDASGAPLPSAAYSFTLESYSGGELIGTTTIQTYGRITEVRNGVSGPEIVLDGGAVITTADIAALRAASG
ncbi:flagellar hook capping FlgD N-terminal domain-containing protein [Defluviimonas aestuarii]|uniref:flagellar hook capping FlgD N-terminal domain-containing protein n=1 Tax=Albidovulum aestuarii TaxID=1130726 RepID=UPI00249AD0E9|nr:flagellar hook capping FlgD N-terminal domain-containing protein [Defluviimonas aestuarii]MDI3338129.1 flagellar hook capping FlgD N-terminal domain-containing protein [Defluviimonas aestuarii]